MKLKFKNQPYQTEAVQSIVDVFEGQPYQDSITYLRDLGIKKDNTQVSYKEVTENATGFENGRLRLTTTELLSNIKKKQMHNRIKQSTELKRKLHR